MSEENENLITDKMVKKATYYIHKLATRRGADFKDIQKKCRQRLGYTNLAKVTLDEGHVIINKLIEWTGGEEEEVEEKPDDLTPQLPTKLNDDFGRSAVNAEPVDRSKNMGATVTDDGSTAKEIVEPKKEEKKIVVQDESIVTSIMREAIRVAVDITLEEVVEREVPVQGLGGFVLELGKVIFEAKMKEEVEQ